MCVRFKNPSCLLVVSLSRGYGSDLCADTGTLFLPDNIQTQHSQTQLHKDENLFFVKGMLMAPSVTAGVSDDVTQELQMPMGQQTLDDAEEPTPARPATLKDPGTLDQIVLDQHSLTHFPSQPWCKMCVDREQSKIDAVVLQLRFDDGYMGDGGPLQIACFLVGSGAIHATMVRDSKNMDMPHVVAGTAKRVRDLGYERVCLHGVKEAVLQLLLGKVAKRMPSSRTRLANSCVTDTEPSGQRRRGESRHHLLEHILRFSKTKSRHLKKRHIHRCCRGQTDTQRGFSHDTTREETPE